MRVPDRLFSELTRAGIHADDHEKRRDMAERLNHDGLRPWQLSRLWEHFLRLAGGDPSAASEALPKRLRTSRLWRPLLRELDALDKASVQQGASQRPLLPSEGEDFGGLSDTELEELLGGEQI